MDLSLEMDRALPEETLGKRCGEVDENERAPLGPPNTGIAYRVKKGVYRFKSHEEADLWWEKVRATAFVLSPQGRPEGSSRSEGAQNLRDDPSDDPSEESETGEGETPRRQVRQVLRNPGFWMERTAESRRSQRER